MLLAVDIARLHSQGMNGVDLGCGEPLDEIVLAVLVHEEADRAAVHAVDRDLRAHIAMQSLQHQAVTAERDNGVGRLRRDIAIAGGKTRFGLVRLRGLARREGDAAKAAAGGGHEGEILEAR